MKDLCFIGLDTQHQEQDVLAFLDESETNTTKNSAVTFQKGFHLS